MLINFIISMANFMGLDDYEHETTAIQFPVNASTDEFRMIPPNWQCAP